VDQITKGRWFRFSLASMLVVVTAFSLWLGRATYVARRQSHAVAAITAAEGIVIFDDESSWIVSVAPTTQLSLLEWLQERIGEDYFRTVEAVDFATNAGRRKGSQEPKATDTSLALLAGVPEVKNLELSHNETVTDESLVHLSGLRNLTTVYLYHTKVCGPGLVHLSKLPNLQYLELSHTPIENIGLEQVHQMHGLKSLRLAHTKITDAGIANLTDLRNLEDLSLKYTDITDESLVYIQKLSSLKELVLTSTKISPAGAQRISQALPNCNVRVSFRLGRTPTDVAFFSDDQQPSADKINAKFKELGIDGHVGTDPTQPGNPIVALYLEHTTISDAAALKLIAEMPLIESMVIRIALVGDEFFQGLAQSDHLRYIEVKEINLTDGGLRHLSHLAKLRDLLIEDADITDDGVQYLAALKKLKRLVLRDVRISEGGFERLRQALPNCQISR
jgi:internalin A